MSKSFFVDTNEKIQLERFDQFIKSGMARPLSYESSAKFSAENFIDLIPIDMNFVAVPQVGWPSVLIPYHVLDHSGVSLGNENLQDCIENFINSSFSKQKYLFSTHPERYFAVEIWDFSYEMFEVLQSGYLTTPFILFDSNEDKCFCVDFDLEINIYSRNSINSDLMLCNKPDVYWDDFFRRNYGKSISFNKSMMDFFDKVIRSHFPNLGKIEDKSNR